MGGEISMATYILYIHYIVPCKTYVAPVAREPPPPPHEKKKRKEFDMRETGAAHASPCPVFHYRWKFPNASRQRPNERCARTPAIVFDTLFYTVVRRLSTPVRTAVLVYIVDAGRIRPPDRLIRPNRFCQWCLRGINLNHPHHLLMFFLVSQPVIASHIVRFVVQFGRERKSGSSSINSRLLLFFSTHSSQLSARSPPLSPGWGR